MKILIPPSEGKLSGGNTKARKISKEEIDILKSKLDIKGKALEHALKVNANITKEKTMPAIERYNGVLYKALDYQNLDKKAQKYCRENVFILSGLFGLIRADEPIPEYKLKIQAAKHLKPVQVKGFVIDLLPKAHAKYVRYEGVRVEFLLNGKQAGHFGKEIKGKFLRWICEEQPKKEDLLKFGKGTKEGNLITFFIPAT